MRTRWCSGWTSSTRTWSPATRTYTGSSRTWRPSPASSSSAPVLVCSFDAGEGGGDGPGWLSVVPTLGFTDPPCTSASAARSSRRSPRGVCDSLEGLVQELCDEIIDGLDPGAVIDFAQEVALQLPVMVIGESLGVAREDRARFNRWADAVLKRLGEEVGEEEDVALIEEYVDLELYFAEQIERRRKEPTDDFLGSRSHPERVRRSDHRRGADVDRELPPRSRLAHKCRPDRDGDAAPGRAP